MASKSQTLVFEVIAQADKAKRDLAELEKASKKAEEPVKVPVSLDGAEKAEADLKAVGDAAEQAAKKVQDVGGGGGGEGLRRVRPAAEDADEGLKTLNRSADGTKNAMANLVGNSAQDLGNMLGPLGSVGVALGQVAEYTADAANEGGGLIKALQGAASVALPIAALSGAMLVVTRVMEDAKAKAAAQEKAIQDMADALIDGTGVLSDWSDALDEGFSEGKLDNVELLNKFISEGLGEENFKKSAVAMGQMDKSLDDLGPTLLAADEDFQSMAEGMAVAAGMTDRQAEAFARLINQQSDLSDVMRILEAPKVKGGPWEALEGIDVEKFKGLASGLAEINDQVDRGDNDKAATKFLDAASAIEEWRGVVDEARASGLSEADAAIQVSAAIEEQKTKREANARAAEEGAKAVQEAGTIQEQVARQLTEAEEAVADAADKAKAAQDNWLIQNVGYEASVDGFTESLQKLTEQTEKQTKAGDEGAGSFEGNTKSALDNRDALRDVYAKATDVIQGMKDAGFSVDGARTAQDNMAQSAYDLAIKMGYPITKAEEIRDRIKEIPASVTTEVAISEQGAAEVEATKKRLEQDTESTHYIYGVLDRSVLNAINSLPPGSIPTSRAAVAPVAPSVGFQAVGAPVAAPQASPASTGASSTATVSQPIVVNVNAGIVADTFQLQRAVVRSARSFQRLSGKRAA